MLLLSQLQCTTCIWDCGWHSDLLLSISFEGSFCHFEKCFLNTQSLDCTRLVKHHVIVFLCPCLSLCCWHYTIGFLIELVANADEWERLRVTWSSILIEAIPPSSERVETLSIRDVINECATISTAIECITKRLELFLTSRIPDLKSDYSVIY